MKNIILVRTHHKTGTAWMGAVFRNLATLLKINYYDISTHTECSDSTVKSNKLYISRLINNKENCIVFEFHNKYDLGNLNKSFLKGLHIIRDPRDVIISAARYHAWSKEEWLHEPSDEYGGLTYQQKINSIESIEDKLIFEMDNTAGWVISCMTDFCDQEVFTTVKYESLIKDYEMRLWHDLSIRLGLEGEEIALSQLAFYRNSLFGMKNKPTHVQDGTACQYKNFFNRTVLEYFNNKFPDALNKLGYI